GTPCGDKSEAEGDEVIAKRANAAFIAVVHADEDSAAAGELLPGGQLRLGKGLAVIGGEAHDFAGGTHFRAEDGVHAAEFVEAENWRLHGVVFAHSDFRHTVMVDDGEF